MPIKNNNNYNDNIDVHLFQYFTRVAGSSEMRLKKIDDVIVFIANDGRHVAMATSYRYDVISRIARCNTEFLL